MFEMNDVQTKEELAKGIKDLGYRVAGEKELTRHKKRFLSRPIERFWFCFPFTALLMLHMIPGVHIHWLMDPWDTTWTFIACVHSGNEFFWKERCKKFEKRNAQYGCAYSIGSHRSICL